MSQQAFVGEPRGEKARSYGYLIRPMNQGTFRVQEAAVNIRKNMARIRELRLAKEVADRATGSTAAKATSKGTKTRYCTGGLTPKNAFIAKQTE